MNTSELREALRRDAELVGEPPGDLLERVEGLRRQSSRRRAGVAAAVVGVALLAAAIPVGGALLGQSDGGDAAAPVEAPTEPTEEPLVLTAGDACGDAFFWATTASGDVAVTVQVVARDRSSVDATTWEFVIPDATVAVEILEGESLGRNFCTDVIDGTAEPPTRQGAVAGAGTITLGPGPEGGRVGAGCGSVSGELELAGLEAEDGTTFAPIRVTSDSIGCYAG